MGVLNLFSKAAPSLLRLPGGSFTVDRHGAVLAGTLPSSFPEELINDLAQRILTVFHDAAAAQLPLSELTMEYPSFKITARELRGGAIIFLVPQNPSFPANRI